MKLYKIIIASISLLLLSAIAIAPTIYSRATIKMSCQHPDRIEKIYGEFDIEIDNTVNPRYLDGYFGYKMGSPVFKMFKKTERFFVIEFDSGDRENPGIIRFHIFEGTDWIEEVKKK